MENSQKNFIRREITKKFFLRLRNAVLEKVGFIDWSLRNSNPLQYSCLENPMDRGACGAKVHGVAKSRT